MEYCSVALQGHCFNFRLDPFYLESHHAKFQLNPLRIGWDIGCRVFRDSAVLHRILQCCRATLLTLPPRESSCKISAQSVEKWLRYRLWNVQGFCSAAWITAVVQGHSFNSGLDAFHLESHHGKFQLNPLRYGWDIGSWRILQRWWILST